jgi:hypothetical protein
MAGWAWYMLSYEKPPVSEEYLYFSSCSLAKFQDTLLWPVFWTWKSSKCVQKEPHDVFGKNVTSTLRKGYLSVNFVCMLTSKTLSVHTNFQISAAAVSFCESPHCSVRALSFSNREKFRAFHKITGNCYYHRKRKRDGSAITFLSILPSRRHTGPRQVSLHVITA